jgi:pilus assembly protein CpaB
MAAKRYSLIFYAAIIVALVSTFGVYRVLEATKASARVVTLPVVIAQKDMAEGAGIDRMAVMVAQWPISTIPAGAFTTVDSVAGRVTRVPIFKGEALVPGRLAPEGTGPGLEVKITPGSAPSRSASTTSPASPASSSPTAASTIVWSWTAAPTKGRVAKVFMENMRILAMNGRIAAQRRWAPDQRRRGHGRGHPQRGRGAHDRDDRRGRSSSCSAATATRIARRRTVRRPPGSFRA